jgi:hypothetical protein
MLIRFGEKIFNSALIAVAAPADDDKSIIWTIGQSAVDQGFLVDAPIKEVEELWAMGLNTDREKLSDN